MDKTMIGLVGFIAGILIGVAGMTTLTVTCMERFNEVQAVYGKADGVFKEGGHYYAYKIVMDTTKTDSLNNWKKTK